MAKNFPHLLPPHQDFIKKQKLFFVASAPTDPKGHVNVSPKGYNSFCILSESEVAYMDLTGSGNETSAHLNENGRLTIMFIAFEGAPMILRLYGKGETILPTSPDWETLSTNFDLLHGARQIIKLKIELVKTSCGFGVPFYGYEGDRETLVKWADQKGEDGLIKYRKEKNQKSIDGLMTPLGEADLE
ncbi:pyridoxamine 5'-phosphate oxidase family protein [Alkalihalobacillus sp. 1P02AB]|uniref:pyridoxamine 5'-phosphate oxidase family protein n=1 Tax=Alkalihalobacillus sp. 1P02AB TaxID=3132260 RepID=UPI0039A5CAE7